MNTPPLENYAAYADKELPVTVFDLLDKLHRKGISSKATGEGNTIFVGQGHGYINSTVLGKDCVLGYQFDARGYKQGYCPEHLIGKLESCFCDEVREMLSDETRPNHEPD